MSDNTDVDTPIDDIEPSEVVSEELLVLLYQQSKHIEELIEQQQEIIDSQQALYDAFSIGNDDPPDEPEEVDEFQSIPEQGFY